MPPTIGDMPSHSVRSLWDGATAVPRTTTQLEGPEWEWRLEKSLLPPSRRMILCRHCPPSLQVLIPGTCECTPLPYPAVPFNCPVEETQFANENERRKVNARQFVPSSPQAHASVQQGPVHHWLRSDFHRDQAPGCVTKVHPSVQQGPVHHHLQSNSNGDQASGSVIEVHPSVQQGQVHHWLQSSLTSIEAPIHTKRLNPSVQQALERQHLQLNSH